MLVGLMAIGEHLRVPFVESIAAHWGKLSFEKCERRYFLRSVNRPIVKNKVTTDDTIADRTTAIPI